MVWCIISGLMAIYTGGRMYQTMLRLKKVGKIIEADVFSVEQSPNVRFHFWLFDFRFKRKTTVCYQNEKQEWIAGKLVDGPVLKKGDKVFIIYDPENPYALVYNDGENGMLNAIFAILLGLSMFGYGLYKYLE